MTRALLRLVAGMGLVGALGASFACAGAPSDSRIGIVAPDLASFPPVGDLLDHRCGSLDCHGNKQRNLQIYGCEGLRLDPDDAGIVPGCKRFGGSDTTQAEYLATYRSLVALEPTVMSAVVASKGAQPELLTFVRKARGAENHKGGQLFNPGDAQDNCVASWLAGQTDAKTCTDALNGTP